MFPAHQAGEVKLVEDDAEIERQVEVLLTKRAGVLEWPDGPNRETALNAIDDVIVKVEMSEPLDTSPD